MTNFSNVFIFLVHIKLY